MVNVLREIVATVMVLESIKNCLHSGPRERTPMVLGNILKFCTIHELSAFTKFGPRYKSVVQHVVRNMIRQSLDNNKNKLIAQQCHASRELNRELGSNLLKEFTCENSTIHVTAPDDRGMALDIARLDVLELTLALPCGVLKYRWDSAYSPPELLDSAVDVTLDSVGEDAWVEILPLSVAAHTRWRKLRLFDLYTLEKAQIVGLL